MYFCCICGEESDLYVLLLCHLEGPPAIGDSTEDTNLRGATSAEAFFSECLQLAFFFFSFMLRLVSLVHRVLHAEASHLAVQIRVPSEKWLR